MKRLPLLSSVLALSLALIAPTTLAHVGHGDEFQAEGGVNRVEVNAETDPLLGILVSPIEPATDGSGAIMIPVTALIEDNGRQLVFVLYETFYEPVPVTTGDTVGDRVEILEGLSVGEQLVAQGSLSLYAESRKTQTAEVAPSAETAEEALVTAEGTISHAEADAQGIAHSHAPDGSLAQAGDGAQAPETTTRQFPWVITTVLGAFGVGAVTVLSGRSRKRTLSEGRYSRKRENV